jgi:site-specific DNA-methyltransferase (adenine-specific)
LAELPRLDGASIDAVVTDPPYELGFMGKKWDASGIAYSVDLWREVLRVLKPGGHLLAFGGTRTYHRMACAIEDAGFEVRDSLHWIYGTGFPKSLNLGDGRGTALKPGHEPIVLARKPLDGTVAANVQEHGTGALNIDGCRIGTETITQRQKDMSVYHGNRLAAGASTHANGTTTTTVGRWPANVLLDEDAAGELDAQSGTLKSGAWNGVTNCATEGVAKGRERERVRDDRGADSGGASRFFYVAKPSRKERDRGCEHLEAENNHPTVKPVGLMRYLCRLVIPPAGIVLDPFAGSGTTIIAALAEGFRAVGIEREAQYVDIAKARIAGDSPLFSSRAVSK